MKNLQKRINRRLKIEKFFVEQLWQLCLVTAFVCICAWIFDKWIVALLFCISHTIIRMSFEKQYHCGATYLCMITTCTIAFLVLLIACHFQQVYYLVFQYVSLYLGLDVLYRTE